MADLLTHAAVAYACARPAEPQVRSVFVLGTVLPDLLYKMSLYIAGGSTWYSEPSHSPLALLLVAFVGALLFEPAMRKKMFVALWLGSWLHILIDLGKDYLGEGVIMWAFPFSMDRVELGLYQPNQTIYFILPALGLALVMEAVCRVFTKKTASLAKS